MTREIANSDTTCQVSVKGIYNELIHKHDNSKS